MIIYSLLIGFSSINFQLLGMFHCLHFSSTLSLIGVLGEEQMLYARVVVIVDVRAFYLLVKRIPLSKWFRKDYLRTCLTTGHIDTLKLLQLRE